ncbi:hypothetical protein Vretimale_12847, partial [Volvox reticuliferus]
MGLDVELTGLRQAEHPDMVDIYRHLGNQQREYTHIARTQTSRRLDRFYINEPMKECVSDTTIIPEDQATAVSDHRLVVLCLSPSHSIIKRYLTQMGYLREVMHPPVQQQGGSDRIDVAEDVINNGYGLVQTQLGLQPTGEMNNDMVTELASARRYNTLPQRMDNRSFERGSTVYYTISGQLARVALKAINAWATALKGHLTFKVADAKNPPDLVINFGSVVDAKKKVKKILNTLGVVTNKTNYPYHLSHVEITETPIKITLYTESMLQMDNPIKDFSAILLHDIGSALGLSDSPYPRDVMNPFYSDKHKSLTQNDINRIKKLY